MESVTKEPRLSRRAAVVETLVIFQLITQPWMVSLVNSCVDVGNVEVPDGPWVVSLLGFVYQIFCCDGCDVVDGIFELGCYKLYDTSSAPPLRQRGRLSLQGRILFGKTYSQLTESRRESYYSPLSPLALYRLFTMVSTPSQDGGMDVKKKIDEFHSK